MSILIKDLEPKKVFEIFDEILKIPRPSGNEKNIASFIVNYAKNIGCSAYIDENGNVIIDAPATEGKENCSLSASNSVLPFIVVTSAFIIFSLSSIFPPLPALPNTEKRSSR